MSRALIGSIIILGFAAYVVYLATEQFDVRCEVCVHFKGRQVCDSSRAASPDEAQMQAVTAACAQLASGVSESVACTRMPPRSIQCSE